MQTNSRTRRYHNAKSDVSSSVLFKYTEKEHNTINAPFRQSLLKLKSGKATQTDWFNTTFRVRSAYLIAMQVYADVTIDELKNVCTICEEIEVRSSMVNHSEWVVTPKEVEWLEAAFDALEQMQRDVPRKLFFDCCVSADKFLRGKYVNRNQWARQAS